MPLFFITVYHAIESISVLSFIEYVRLVAATYLMYKNEPEKTPIDRTKYHPEQLKQMDEALKLVKPTVQAVEILNLKFTVPLRQYADEIVDFDYIVTLYLAYKNHGLLPYEGLISDQPYKLIETFNVINAVINTLQEQDRKALEKKQQSKTK